METKFKESILYSLKVIDETTEKNGITIRNK